MNEALSELTRNPFEDADLSDDDSDDSDMAPLVASPLEIDYQKQHSQNVSVSRGSPMWKSGDISKVLITLVLTSVIILPMLLGHFSAEEEGIAADDDFVVPSCAAEEFDQTFEELMMEYRNEPNITKCYVEPSRPDRTCNCNNPTLARPMSDEHIGPLWEQTFKQSKDIALDAVKTFGDDGVDVVLLGDSITEHWLGTDLSMVATDYDENAKAFHDLFTVDGGGQIDGISLGVAAERCGNLLYRLQNELLGDLKAKVIWLLIGTNDLGGDHCSVEATVAGNIAIVEELQIQRPDTLIVINSVLPRDGILAPMINDINQRLRCYATLTNSVAYFDATRIFWDKKTNKTKNMVDGVHPNGRGSQLWGKKIVETVAAVEKEAAEDDG